MNAVEPAPALEHRWRHYELAASMAEKQIDRQWSMTQFFVLLNASVVGGALTLLQLDTNVLVSMLLLAVLAGGTGLALAGYHVVGQNKQYYRRLLAKKTLLEHTLGLAGPISGFEDSKVATMSLGSTVDQGKVRDILLDPDAYVQRDVRRWSLTHWAQWTFIGFATFDVVAIVLIAWHLLVP